MLFPVTWAVDARLFCAVIAAALSLLAFAPYIRDTLARRTAPQRSSWLIWSALSVISFFSQVSEGASLSLLFAAAQTGGTLVIFCLAISRGVGAYLRGSDGFALGGAAVGLMMWSVTDSALWTLLIACSISLLGGVVTLKKAYEQPESETMSCWLISFAASAMALASIGGDAPILLIYPGYLFTLYGAIIVTLLLARHKDRLQKAQLGLSIVSAADPQPSVLIELPVEAQLSGTESLPGLTSVTITDFNADEDVLVIDAAVCAQAVAAQADNRPNLTIADMLRGSFKLTQRGESAILSVGLLGGSLQVTLAAIAGANAYALAAQPIAIRDGSNMTTISAQLVPADPSADELAA